MKKQTQAEYYKQHAFNPTAFSIEDDAVFQDHYRKRMNLYERRLKIPRGFWNGKHVLEVGCSSGENALILAACGASFTFIDPMEASLARLRELFASKGFAGNIRRSIAGEIQNMTLTENYDCIIAEGFLYTLQERAEVIRTFLRHLKPHGLLSVSTLDPVGCFVEFFKKALFQQMYRAAGAMDLPQQMVVAGQLFEEDYEKIPHSRPFASWVRDNFLNPTFDANSLWSIRQIIQDTRTFRPRVYSAWPRLEHANDMSWYKKVETYEQELNTVEHAYTKRITCFFHGKTLDDGFLLPSLEVAGRFQSAVLKTTRKMSKMFSRRSVSLKELLPDIREMKKAALKSPDASLLVPVIQDVLTVAKNPSSDAYRAAKQLRSTWGVGYPYYVLQRTD